MDTTSSHADAPPTPDTPPSQGDVVTGAPDPAASQPPAPPSAPADSVAPTPSESAPPEIEPDTKTIPLARLQGVQRQLVEAQRATTTAAAERDAARAQIEQLTAQLADAKRATAAAMVAHIKATDAEAVHELITGDTPEAVRASHEQAKAAYATARSAYARSLPTSAPAPSQSSRTVAPQPVSLTPSQLIAAGLNATQPNIN